MPTEPLPTAKRGRPSGLAPAKKKMLIALDHHQREYLDAIREASEFGRPAYTELVKAGVDLLIRQALSKPEMRRKVEDYLGARRKAALKVVSGDKA